MVSVLIFDTLPGLAIGVCVSLLLLLARTSRPHLALAHSIGRVRDVLSIAATEGEPPIYATIEDALESAPPPVHEYRVTRLGVGCAEPVRAARSVRGERSWAR
jgi:MFS superfamily sulfate permease-like transporter